MAAFAGAYADGFVDEFADPPAKYGVNCWWWWLNGNTDKATISGELAAMKAKRFQGALVFDAGGWKHLGHRDGTFRRCEGRAPRAAALQTRLLPRHRSSRHAHRRNLRLA